MELTERISILKQATEVAQKNGCLSLNEAVIAKQSIDAIDNGISIKEGLSNLVKIAELAQKKGVYSLKDAFFIYAASEGIENLVIGGQPAPQPAPQVFPPEAETNTKKTKTK